MYFYAGLVLVLMVIAFIVGKKLKLSVELCMLCAALTGSVVYLISDGEFPLRHIVEGSFTYLDVVLIFITATFFMNLLKESGGIAYLVRKIVVSFHKRRNVCLLLLTFVLLIPGALTGAGAATVLTVGTLVGTVLMYMGINKEKTAAIIFICAAMSAAAPPINLWAMMAAAGSNMPYVGFFLPLLVLTVTGALFAMFFLGRKGTPIDINKALKELPVPPEKMNGFRVGVPFLVLFALILASRIWPFQMPIIGLPLMFILASLSAIILSPKKLKILDIATHTVKSLIPLIGMMIVVGILIQIMALTGARGLISLGVVTLPVIVLYFTLFIILPVSEGLLQYAVAPLLGVPLILLFNMKGLNPIIALSAMAVMWPVGDILPPTAVVGRAVVMELNYKGNYYKGFLKTSLIPMLFILLLATLFIVFSNQLSFLVAG